MKHSPCSQRAPAPRADGEGREANSCHPEQEVQQAKTTANGRTSSNSWGREGLAMQGRGDGGVSETSQSTG